MSKRQTKTSRDNTKFVIAIAAAIVVVLAVILAAIAFAGGSDSPENPVSTGSPSTSTEVTQQMIDEIIKGQA